MTQRVPRPLSIMALCGFTLLLGACSQATAIALTPLAAAAMYKNAADIGAWHWTSGPELAKEWGLPDPATLRLVGLTSDEMIAHLGLARSTVQGKSGLWLTFASPICELTAYFEKGGDKAYRARALHASEITTKQTVPAAPCIESVRTGNPLGAPVRPKAL